MPERRLRKEPVISIVDDDQFVRDSLKRLMKSVGYMAAAYPSALGHHGQHDAQSPRWRPWRHRALLSAVQRSDDRVVEDPRLAGELTISLTVVVA
jgi:hypothetical protein